MGELISRKAVKLLVERLVAVDCTELDRPTIDDAITMLERLDNQRVALRAGATTCSEKPSYPGSMCRFVGTKGFGTMFVCRLFGDEVLTDKDKWLQRLPQCLAEFG